MLFRRKQNLILSLSNSPGVASTDAQIAAEGKNVYIIWWERSGNTAEPFLRISYDNGNTFGQKIMLSNATAAAIGSTVSNGAIEIITDNNGQEKFVINLITRATYDNLLS